MSSNLEEYQNELAEVLRTYDKEQILTFFAAHNLPTPSNDQSFWGAVHKMRLTLPSFTEEERAFSREWLTSHGMKSRGGIPENLQRHMNVFTVKLMEMQQSGLDDEEASKKAAEAANEQFPLSEEDIAALKIAGSM